jgi:amidophosphoribosyltransferase
VEAAEEGLEEVEGAYGFLLLTPNRLVGARDPGGIRPLVLGRLDGAVVLASETCALDAVEARFEREVAPGEMVVVEAGGRVTSRWTRPGRTAAEGAGLCIFEYIYFARLDSDLEGKNVHLVREAMGRALAEECPVEADLVTGVPDSSLSAAAGYAKAAGIPYEVALVKNRYVGRTFIQPDPAQRALGVRLKLNAIRRVVEGKRVILLDDYIVRGTTSRRIVRLLREAGAREVHLRISSPPYRFPCFYGIDTSASSELIAADKEVDEIRELVEADSLAYLSVEGLARAVGGTEAHCSACFTGKYPVPIPAGAGKFSLE